VGWFALGATVILQLLAGIVRARAWFHVIRHSWPGPTRLRYRDVVMAHLGGIGWNAILPAHTGDAVKVILVNRKMPERRLALLGATTLPPAIVEGVFTALLLTGLVVTSLVSLDALTTTVHPAGMALIGGAVLVVWLVAGRVLRLFAYAAVLPAAGLPFELVPALALMALQGATPSAGAAATPARIALLAAVLAGTGASGVSPAHVAAALATAYAVTSAANLAVSVSVIAWLLRTTSPRRILSYVRSSIYKVKSGTPVPAAAPSRVR
jgi:hypothetical protein